jgi:hypothetical protein
LITFSGLKKDVKCKTIFFQVYQSRYQMYFQPRLSTLALALIICNNGAAIAAPVSSIPTTSDSNEAASVIDEPLGVPADFQLDVKTDGPGAEDAEGEIGMGEESEVALIPAVRAAAPASQAMVRNGRDQVVARTEQVEGVLEACAHCCFSVGIVGCMHGMSACGFC